MAHLSAGKTKARSELFPYLVAPSHKLSSPTLKTLILKFQFLTHYGGGDVLFTEASPFLSSWQDAPIFGAVKPLCVRACVVTANVSLKSCTSAREAPGCFLGRRWGQNLIAQFSPLCAMEPSLLPGDDLGWDSSLLHLPCLQDRVEARRRAVGETAAERRGPPGSREGLRIPYRSHFDI